MAVAVNPIAVPEELRRLPQWVVWTQPEKRPFNPRSLAEAKTNDPATWGTFAEAVARYESSPDRFAGIGFVFTADDPYTGIDLDDCIRDGITHPSAWRLIQRLDSYSEVSPSGKGVKVIVRAAKPGQRCKRVLHWADDAPGQVEVYDRLRYFTITGDILPDTPIEIQDRQDAVASVYATLFPAPTLKPVAHPDVPSNAYDRCLKYLEKCPESISGDNGHDKALRAACECFRFGLSEGEAWNAMRWWSASKSGDEPWSDKELQHKIESAKAKVESDGDFGRHLADSNGNIEPYRFTKPKPGASADVVSRIGRVRDGTYIAAPWVWPTMTRLTQSLLPGSITLLCGTPGGGKSFFIYSACLGWLEMGVPFAIFELEDDRTYHLQRALAVLARNAKFVDLDWVRANHAPVESASLAFGSTLDALGAAMTDAPERRVTLGELGDWYESVAGSVRVAVIDPVTAASAGEKRWLEDGKFMERVKTVARRTESSLVLVTHPRVGTKKHVNLDDLAGGADYARFAHSVLVLAGHDGEDVTALGPHGRSSVTPNRMIHVRKARNGIGSGSDIAFTFSPKDLGFVEHGVVVDE